MHLPGFSSNLPKPVTGQSMVVDSWSRNCGFDFWPFHFHFWARLQFTHTRQAIHSWRGNSRHGRN